MNDHDFMRYSRQLLLEDIAIEGQQKLLASRVLIIGLGGLGSPAALYLAGAGVGTLTTADDDAVHLSNLQRQILFTSADIDRPKAAAAQTRLSQLNPQIKLVALQQRLSGEALRAEVAKADVVLDCTDNMVTRRGDQCRLCGPRYPVSNRQRRGLRRSADGAHPATEAGLLSLPVAGKR